MVSTHNLFPHPQLPWGANARVGIEPTPRRSERRVLPLDDLAKPISHHQPSYQAPHRGIEPRPTVSKTAMQPSHPQGKSCRALNGFINPGCVVQARRELTVWRTERHSRKASQADGELNAVALPTANQPTNPKPRGEGGIRTRAWVLNRHLLWPLSYLPNSNQQSSGLPSQPGKLTSGS